VNVHRPTRIVRITDPSAAAHFTGPTAPCKWPARYFRGARTAQLTGLLRRPFGYTCHHARSKRDRIRRDSGRGRKQSDVRLCDSAKKLWDLVTINQRTEDKEEGYQRTLNAVRVRRIARYIDGGHVIPTSVLISFDKGRYDEVKRVLAVPENAKVGWVIDGQHRLAGSREAVRDITVPVVAFVGLSENEQIEFFVTIQPGAEGRVVLLVP